MDDEFEGGIIIATEADLDSMMGAEQFPFNIETIPGRNIKTGCYGLFLVALDQCEDPTEKATLEEAIDALDEVVGCLVSSALTMYYPKVPLDYKGILSLAEVFVFLADYVPGKHALDLTEEQMVRVDETVSELLGVSTEDAVKSFFESLGFTPLEIPDDGPRQLELTFE